MPSDLAWVDFSADERERMRRAIALIGERDVRDELGLGTIRDAFAERFFPGTSTIQTRMRYFLLVPWCCRAVEARGRTADRFDRDLRKVELALAEVLRGSVDPEGSFGRVAGATIKRLPGSVYWSGLRRWEILRFRGSQAEYHEELEQIRRAHERAIRPDDEGVFERGPAIWHERLPGVPDEFPNGASFALTRAEAEYLQDRISATCGGSILARFASQGRRSDVAFAWLHPDAGMLSRPQAAELDLARRFSAVVLGAALLYNLMLAERCSRDDRLALIDKYRAKLSEWASSDERDDLGGWSAFEVREFVSAARAAVPPATLRFVEDWMGALAAAGAARASGDASCRRLVQAREERIKRGRSRFRNPRALDQWGGAAGAARIDYRWPAVQRILNDLHAGLGGRG
jgi:hypothetical protein